MQIQHVFDLNICSYFWEQINLNFLIESSWIFARLKYILISRQFDEILRKNIKYF